MCSAIHAVDERTNLLHVEDLDTVVARLGSNDHVIVVATNFAPLAGGGVLGQASKVDQLSLLANLCKSSAIRLTNRDELTSS
jgi:hypothetical protein